MSTTAERQYNFLNDYNAGTPIDDRRVDAELDNIITKLNQKSIISASAPSSPIAGMLWYDSTNKLLKQYRNSEWVVVGVHVGTAAPTTAQEGDLWWDSTNDILYVYESSTAKRQVITTDQFGAKGTLLTSEGQGTTPAALAIGTLGQLLKSNGIGSAPSWITLSDALGTAYVQTTDLDTDIGEVSSTAEGPIQITLAGGEYGFFPQIKGSPATTSGDIALLGGGDVLGTAPGNYTTQVAMRISGAGTLFAQQRYVTASGEDYWLFLLVDKTTKEVIASYAAPDHPSYGNGGNPNKLPHPFTNFFDETKHELILIDQETIREMEKKVTFEKSLLDIVLNEYKINMDAEIFYSPLHSGKYMTKDEDGKKVQVKQLITDLPDYIKVKKMDKRK